MSRKEGGRVGGVKENDRVTKAFLTHCHTPLGRRPRFLFRSLSFRADPQNFANKLLALFGHDKRLNEMTLRTVIFIAFQWLPSLCRALGPQSSDHTLDVFFRNLAKTQGV